MAEKTDWSPVFTPTVTIVSVISAVVSIGTFLVQVLPGVRSLTASICASALALVYLGYALRRGVLLGSPLQAEQRRLVGAWMIVILGFSLLLVVRAVGALGEPPHPVVTAASAATPLPATFQDNIDYSMHAAPAQDLRSLEVRYYVVSDPNFFETLFERTAFFEGFTDIQDLEATEPESRTMIGQLLDPERSHVAENETFRFMRALWMQYLEDRRPIAELNESFSALKARPTFDTRFTDDGSDYSRTVWFEADTATLLEDGWLDLDPLSRLIARANPSMEYPVVKAGAMLWDEGEECGGGAEVTGRYAYAFVVPRKVQLVFLDIQNVGSQDVDEVVLDLRRISVASDALHVLRSPSEEDALIASGDVESYMIPEGLGSGEHYLVPVAVVLGEYDDRVDFEPGSVPAAFFGPGERVMTIRTDDSSEAEDVRAFDPTNLSYLFVGYSGACCPALYTRLGPQRRWVKEGNVLVNFSTSDAEAEDRCDLRQFDGSLRLSEEDLETSYIDRLVVVVDGPFGERVLEPDVAELRLADAERLRLDHGESIVVRFPEWNESMGVPQAVATGYYIPF